MDHYALLTSSRGFQVATHRFSSEAELLQQLEKFQARGTVAGYLWQKPAGFPQFRIDDEVVLTSKLFGSYRIETIAEDPDAPLPQWALNVNKAGV